MPQLEHLEDRCLLSAVETLPGFSANTLGHVDDGFVQANIGFTANFFGKSFNQVFVNNNGNVTVGQGNTFWSSINFSTTFRTIFAPFDADVDATVGNTVTYGTDVINGHNAFAATWPLVGFYQQHTDKLDSFQVVFIDRSDTGAGNFDLEYNYNQIQWESGDASFGKDGLGGQSAVVGWSAGTKAAGTFYTMPGSGVPGTFLDSNTSTGLIYNSLNSTVPGRYVFTFRGGNLSTNQPPVPNAGGPYTVAEGGSLTLNGLGSTDPDGDPLTYSWDVNGDGNTDVTGATPTLTWAQLQAIGITDGPATYNVFLSVNDGQGHTVCTGPVTLTVTDPTPVSSISGPATTDEGSTYTLNLSASDPGGDPIDGWTINWGDGSTPQTVAGNATSVTHVYADGPNDFTISATITNVDGTFATGNTVAVHVNNVPPTLTLSGNATVDEGSTYTLGLSASDPGQDTISSWAINWGDGNLQLVSGNPSSVTHVYANGPSDYTISATAADEDGAYVASNTVAVHVNNVAPVLNGLTTSATYSGGSLANDNVTVNANFSDAGTLDTHTVVINWGDGTTSNATVSESGGAGTATGSHIYTQANTFTITVTVTDNDQASVSGTTTATVTVATGAHLQNGTLYIIGTPGDDFVQVNEFDHGQLSVRANFLPDPYYVTFPVSGIQQIVVQLGGGNNTAIIAGNVDIPTLVDGTAGVNNAFVAGGGPSILMGGSGSNLLVGGRGRDILIGGTGQTTLVGGSGQDIVIAGTTTFDNNYAALWSILGEWNSSRTLDQRVADLSGTGHGASFDQRQNGNNFLISGVTVQDSAKRDRRIRKHQDWVFANNMDWVEGLGRHRR
jgi:hypothetical protein